MIGGVTRHLLPHLSGVPHLHVNRPLITDHTNDVKMLKTLACIRGAHNCEGGWRDQDFDILQERILS